MLSVGALPAALCGCWAIRGLGSCCGRGSLGGFSNPADLGLAVYGGAGGVPGQVRLTGSDGCTYLLHAAWCAACRGVGERHEIRGRTVVRRMGCGAPSDAFLCCLCSFASKRTCQALGDTARRFAGVACPHVLPSLAIDREDDVGVLANAPEPCLPVVVVIRSVRAISLEMPVCRDWRDLSAVAVPTGCRRIFALGVSGSWLF